MRIVGGEFKSRRIAFPKACSVRPTKDRVREAVFNIIAGKVQGAAVLDLYAGSGAFGIEAISRGARKAVFVDDDMRCVRVIRDNIKTLGIPRDVAVVFRMEAKRALKKLAEQLEAFDIIFMDPPYGRELAKQSLILASNYGMLSPGSFAVIEHHRDDEAAAPDIALKLRARKRYGDSVISIFGA
ncbi:MAG: 16S rRNA (guanine(966)-N(2))-methyltransferase RsmD [Candidatus Omnitrophota bacterium]